MLRHLIIALALPGLTGALAACSSGGGGGGDIVSPPPSPPPPAAPPPSPPPPAAPPPSPPSPPSPPIAAPPPYATPSTSLSTMSEDVLFRAGKSYYQKFDSDEFGLITIVFQSAEFSQPRGEDTVHYDADADAFTLSMNLRNGTFFTQTFGPEHVVAAESDDIVTVYERDGDRLVLTNPGDPGLGLQFVATAGWRTDDSVDNEETDYLDDRGYAVFGFETPFANMPNAGSATYSLHVFGTLIDSSQVDSPAEQLGGDGSLVADFANGLVEISLDIDRIDAAGVATPWDTAVGRAVILASPTGGASNAFEGVISRTGGLSIGAVENFEGAFYGVNAEEVGGAFYFSSHRLAGGEEAFGSFVGATTDATTPRPGLNASLVDLDLTETFAAFNISTYVLPDGGDAFASQTSPNRGVTYNASTDTFHMPIASRVFDPVSLAKLGIIELGPATLDASASDATKSVHRLPNESGLIDDLYTLYTPGGGSPYALDYAAIGVWENADVLASIGIVSFNAEALVTHVVYGHRTPATDIPTSGSAVYDISAIGLHSEPETHRTLVGSGTIEATFTGPARFDIDLELGFDGPVGVTPWLTFEESEAGNLRSNWAGYGSPNFIFGIQAVDDPDIAGWLSGAFFGPDAQEIGGVFDIQETDEETSEFLQQGVGAFVGEKRP